MKTKKKSTRRHVMNIADIKVGKRHRRDLGDIAALAEGIREDGLLHPIVIQPDGKLIAGARRLAAYKKLGRTQIPVTVIDIDDIARGEMTENTARKDFTPSELVAITDAVAKRESELAKKRMTLGKVSTGSNGKTRDKLNKVAKPLGMSGKTLEKARAVVNAAAKSKRFRPLVEQMDKTGHVDRAFKQLKVAHHREEHAKRIEHGCRVDDLVALAVSGKRFSVIYADPAWPFKNWSPAGRLLTAAENCYNVSQLDEIMRLPVATLAADDCALLLWCTWPHIVIGSHTRVMEAWGFRPSTCAFVWVKTEADGKLFIGDECPTTENTAVGNGYWTRSNSEVCLIAIKGSPTRLDAAVRQVVFAPVAGHSEKPEEVRHRIEQLYAGPYLELYARPKADGKVPPSWVQWGNEIRREQFREAAE